MTKIGWTNHTFNPWWGCHKNSPECARCYADSFAKRTGHKVWGESAPRRFFGDAHWDEPLKWNRRAREEGVRKRVFCGSMCDVMEAREDLIASRERLYSLIEKTEWLDWLLLTKFPQYFEWNLPQTWLRRPLHNVWGMTTVGCRESMWRVHRLLSAPFVIRGLSCEPLLEDLDLTPYRRMDWVIAGAESGPGARPMDEDWVRSLRDQCAATKTAFFYKQKLDEKGRAIETPFLDGRQWVEFPEVRNA